MTDDLYIVTDENNSELYRFNSFEEFGKAMNDGRDLQLWWRVHRNVIGDRWSQLVDHISEPTPEQIARC
jgi:hypothetical protein